MARASSRRPAAKKNGYTVDLSGVEGRINFTEGDHLLEVEEVTVEGGPKGDYFNWKFKAAEDDESEGAIVYNNTSLSEASLWNLRTLLEALGVEIPDGPMDLDFDELVGLQVMGSIELETYEGKKRPRLVDFWEAEEAPAEPAPKAGRKGRAAAKEEPELTARQKRALARKAKADEAEEKEEAKPSRSSRGSKRAAEKEPEPEPDDEDLTEEAINDMTQDELEDLIKEEDLDVDLSEFKTLRKMRTAVVDAAEEAGLFGDAEPEPEPEPAPRRRRAR